MRNKISVITVVFNDVAHIKETMESYFSQTWEEKEYIVIDGGSTDGTADIISKYADRLAYWCSEPDGGIFDAMNKGIKYAKGDWINIKTSLDISWIKQGDETEDMSLAELLATIQEKSNKIADAVTKLQALLANIKED